VIGFNVVYQQLCTTVVVRSTVTRPDSGRFLRMLDHRIQISFNSRCEIIAQTPAWAYKYE